MLKSTSPVRRQRTPQQLIAGGVRLMIRKRRTIENVGSVCCGRIHKNTVRVFVTARDVVVNSCTDTMRDEKNSILQYRRFIQTRNTYSITIFSQSSSVYSRLTTRVQPVDLSWASPRLRRALNIYLRTRLYYIHILLVHTHTYIYIYTDNSTTRN